MAAGGGVRWRSRRAESRWLVAAAVVIALAGALPEEWLGPRWVRFAVAVACATGAVWLDRSKETAKTADARSDVLMASTSSAAARPAGGFRLARELELRDLRVHHPLIDVPYLHRQVETELEAALASGDPALVVGNSMAGKTRMAAHVLQRRFPDRPVVIPDVPDGLATLLGAGAKPLDAVIWLDDLGRYLADPKHLKERWLADLRHDGNLVLATISELAYEAYRPTGELPSTQWPLLTDFTLVRIVDTDTERERLADQLPEQRVHDGVLRYGLGGYIGGGLLAKEAFEGARNAHPRAYGLIRAAVDWSRSGIGEAIPRDIATGLITAYVDQRQVDEHHETLDAAVTWATSRDTGRGAFRLLTPTADGWRPFDYLVDLLGIGQVAIHEQAWAAIAEAAVPEGNLMTAGFVAYDVGRTDTAERLYRRAANLGETGSMVNLGVLLRKRGEVAEAERLYRRAAALGNAGGMANLGGLLQERGEAAEAERLYRQAVALGDAGGMANLGALLEERGGVEEAERLYRQAVALGDAGGMANLGALLWRRGEVEEAERLYRRSVALGDAGGMTNLGSLLWGRGEVEEAERLYRRAVALGDAGGMTNLGALLWRRGEVEEAERLYRRSVALGNAGGMANLGGLLEKRGEVEEAERLYRQAVALGNAGGMANLGGLLWRRGEAEEAERLYRRAAALGNAGGMTNLGAILGKRGEAAEAERLYRRAVALGDAGGMANLGALLQERGGVEEAERLYRQAVALGNAGGMTNLGALLWRRGEVEEAERLYRRSVALGDAGGMTNLGAILGGRGEVEEAERLLRRAVALGDAGAARNLRRLLGEDDA